MSLSPVTQRVAEALVAAVPRVTVASMVVVPVPVPVAEHPEAVRAADATVVSAEAHVQAGSALGSPPAISRVNSAVWPVSTVSAAGERTAVSGGGVTRRSAEAVAVSAPRVTVASMVVVPVPVPVAEHPEAVRAADATVVSAEAHVQAGSALGSPPAISRVNSAVWPVSTVSAAGERTAVSGGGGGGGGTGAVGPGVPDPAHPAKKKDAQCDQPRWQSPLHGFPSTLAIMGFDGLVAVTSGEARVKDAII